jgi:hypothetical protein
LSKYFRRSCPEQAGTTEVYKCRQLDQLLRVAGGWLARHLHPVHPPQAAGQTKLHARYHYERDTLSTSTISTPVILAGAHQDDVGLHLVHQGGEHLVPRGEVRDVSKQLQLPTVGVKESSAQVTPSIAKAQHLLILLLLPLLPIDRLLKLVGLGRA